MDSASAAKDRLIQGNTRFRNRFGRELDKHVSGQSPYAAVLACSDSRVPSEHIFDAGIGEIFVIRNAGNVAFDAGVLGSLDYAVGHLHVPLLIVMGHTNCGAVAASEKGPGDDSSIGRIAEEIRCCFGTDDNIRQNVRRQAEMLPKRSRTIAEAVKNGELEVAGAVYNLEDGLVEFI